MDDRYYPIAVNVILAKDASRTPRAMSAIVLCRLRVVVYLLWWSVKLLVTGHFLPEISGWRKAVWPFSTR